mmetsp:Transcript_4342/g.9055  ORF Transcript_4342/g.9055 Transcript_4342/m.9055 type:complete len:302 (+) Transcript_4342:2-907(+)
MTRLPLLDLLFGFEIFLVGPNVGFLDGLEENLIRYICRQEPQPDQDLEFCGLSPFVGALFDFLNKVRTGALYCSHLSTRLEFTWRSYSPHGHPSRIQVGSRDLRKVDELNLGRFSPVSVLQFDPQGIAKSSQRVLRGAIDCSIGNPDQSRDGRNHNDPGFLRFRNRRKGAHQRIDDPVHIELEQVIDRIHVLDFFKVAPHASPGIQHQNIKILKGFCRFLDHLFDLFVIGEVTLENFGLSCSQCKAFGFNPFELGLVSGHQRQVGSLLCKLSGELGTDPGAGARYQNVLPFCISRTGDSLF